MYQSKMASDLLINFRNSPGTAAQRADDGVAAMELGTGTIAGQRLLGTWLTRRLHSAQLFEHNTLDIR